MTNAEFSKVILLSADAATYARWRRSVVAFYAGIILILVAAWGVYHPVNSAGGTQIAEGPDLTSLSDPVLGRVW